MKRRTFLTGGLVVTLSARIAFTDERPPADAVNYESLDQLKALAARGAAIVYFHAEWCPVCQSAMLNYRARWDEVQPGITLVLADYDKETALKAQFGATYQNSYVQVGANGEALQIWNGGGIEALNERPIFASR